MIYSSSLFNSILQVLSRYRFLTTKENTARSQKGLGCLSIFIFQNHPQVMPHKSVPKSSSLPVPFHVNQPKNSEDLFVPFIYLTINISLSPSLFPKGQLKFLNWSVFELCCIFFKCLFRIGVLNPKCDQVCKRNQDKAS